MQKSADIPFLATKSVQQDQLARVQVVDLRVVGVDGAGRSR